MVESSRSFEAVVFDLFGTLVAAPSHADRLKAVSALAACMDVAPSVVDAALSASWQLRHDGQLRSSDAVAAHLVGSCSADDSTTTAVAACLGDLAAPRLRADGSVLDTIRALRTGGVQVGVLSDAAAEIAEAWEHSALADVVDHAVFSCKLGKTKPHPKLYSTVLSAVDVRAERSVYCGDGGGSELAGARRAGMRAVRVRRRGGMAALAFGERSWAGLTIASVEHLPALLESGHLR